jgi:hypothetical protein
MSVQYEPGRFASGRFAAPAGDSYFGPPLRSGSVIPAPVDGTGAQREAIEPRYVVDEFDARQSS